MADSAPPHLADTGDDETGLVGMHVVYTYENGWEYEMYYKSQVVVDYRARRCMVAGRWVKDQPAHICRLKPAASDLGPRFMVNWAEPTGTTVCQVLDLGLRVVDIVAFFPRWVALDPAATVCFQNRHLPRMAELRDAGPTYPLHVVNEHSVIHTMRNVGPGDDSVISSANVTGD